jgi:hypothetical protein
VELSALFTVLNVRQAIIANPNVEFKHGILYSFKYAAPFAL